MQVNPFSLSNVLLLLISAGLAAYFLFVGRLIKKKEAGLNLPSFTKQAVRFAVAYAMYIVLISVLAADGFFSVITKPPRALFIFLPLLAMVFLLVKAKGKTSLSFLTLLPPVYLVSIQTFRIFIELLFVQFANDGLLPVQLSLHGRNVDFFIGVLAIPVAILLYKKHRLAQKAAIAFNALGLLSLANIFSIVIVSMPSSFQVYKTFYLPTYFPGVTIVFAASAAVFLHVLSLRQLWMMKEDESLRKIVAPKQKRTLTQTF